MSELKEKELEIFTSKSRADKAVNSLKGILIGINLDHTVNDKEVLELKKWSENHQNLITRNPFKEFITNINQILLEDFLLSEIIEDLLWLCEKYERKNHFYDQITADLQLLQGICHGILSDGVITEDEIINLHQWLQQNSHLNSYYPYDEIRSLILSIVSDGVIEEEEIKILKAYLNQFIELQDEKVATKINEETIDINISAHCTSEPNVEIQGKTFCITGVLKSGNRSELEANIVHLGGIPTKTITQKTDYLIVGDNGNKAWAFACYGRKVEKALQLRRKGHKISLIHEFDFNDVIEDLM